MKTKGKSKRHRPRPDNDDDEEEPKANILLWSIGLAVFIGGFGFLFGYLFIDLSEGIKIGSAGFGLGLIGGAIAGVIDRVPTNKYLGYGIGHKN